jgi:cytidine deaminase
MIPEDLFQAALAVRDHAHAPYSNYRVSSAIRAASGRVYVGTNVENLSYGGSICAERSAACAMVAGGDTQILELVVITEEGGTPCGICRQFLAEFATDDTLVWCASPAGSVQTHRMGDLLPHAWNSAVVRRTDETS